MTPKEKAIELVDKFYDYVNCWDNDGANYTQAYNYAKKCASIAVDELIFFSNTELLSEVFEGDYYCDVDFFESVKQEIEKL